MKENMISIGLDIGTTKIVAMIGQTNEYNKMKIWRKRNTSLDTYQLIYKEFEKSNKDKNINLIHLNNTSALNTFKRWKNNVNKISY